MYPLPAQRASARREGREKEKGGRFHDSPIRFHRAARRSSRAACTAHTTRSDGKGSPEEVIRLHKQNGYDFLALTDHRVYNYKNFAPDADIVIVPGMEMDRNIEGFAGVHCFHTVCLGTKDSTYAQEQTFPTGA